jgi:SMC interacting uncharacterized protein involved in chromosome segregation
VQAKRESRRQHAERWAAEAAARREQVAAVRDDNAALQQRVESQPYTAEQAARMNAEKCVGPVSQDLVFSFWCIL